MKLKIRGEETKQNEPLVLWLEEEDGRIKLMGERAGSGPQRLLDISNEEGFRSIGYINASIGLPRKNSQGSAIRFNRGE